jgi:hypothetical protein
MARGFIRRIFSYFSLSLLASLSLSLHVYGCASDTAEKMKVERKHSKQYKRQKKIGKKWRGFQIIKQKYAQQRRMYKKRQITRSCTSEKKKKKCACLVCVCFFSSLPSRSNETDSGKTIATIQARQEDRLCTNKCTKGFLKQIKKNQKIKKRKIGIALSLSLSLYQRLFFPM